MSAAFDLAEETIAASRIADASAIVGRKFVWLRGGTGDDGAALKGQYRLTELRPGLVLHSSDTTELTDLDTRIEQRSGVTFYLFLKGAVDATIDGRPIMPASEGDGHTVRAAVMVRTRPTMFSRRSRRGEHLRKVNVTVSHEWLADCGLSDPKHAPVVAEFCRTHLARHGWRPGASMIAIGEQILRPPSYEPALQKLYLESRALELVAEGLGQLNMRPACWATGHVGSRDLHRMRRIEDYLRELPNPSPSLDEIAAATGASVSTLQRLFHSVHGMSAFDYVRRRNLNRARRAIEQQGLSVAEAAHMAGYRSASNFSTAFKRHFGISPGSVR
ncbi:helix-turn-helix transcriptional regulator [Jiella pacifica]|uniref:Helix-turn-helix domain-containing protein n=1 Tax=Jiella pacifica TaxID=2696469 RepID=A0A6N9T0V8_9HYPH|nr:AraC family transcriptional regulator [Jiella pacifica]NDW04960.1 helix-turn-helix domain-containing protein [Jiella pacifica]